MGLYWLLTDDWTRGKVQMIVTGSTFLGKMTLTAGHDQSGKMVKVCALDFEEH